MRTFWRTYNDLNISEETRAPNKSSSMMPHCSIIRYYNTLQIIGNMLCRMKQKTSNIIGIDAL